MLNISSLTEFSSGGGSKIIFDETAHNLINSIRKRTPERTCYIYLNVFKGDDGGLFVGVPEWRLTLRSVISEIQTKQFATNICFLSCEDRNTYAKAKVEARALGKPSIVVLSSDMSWRFLFVFIWCTQIHGLRAALEQKVTLNTLKRVCRSLFSSLGEIVEGQCFAVDFVVQGKNDHMVWAEGENYAPEIDVENLGGNSSLEERDDALKRVADAVAFRNPESVRSSVYE